MSETTEAIERAKAWIGGETEIYGKEITQSKADLKLIVSALTDCERERDRLAERNRELEADRVQVITALKTTVPSALEIVEEVYSEFSSRWEHERAALAEIKAREVE